MEFGRGISIPHPQEGESFKFPATWIPAIPAKPVPIRPHMTTVTERSNWMGCPPEFIQRNPTIPNATSLGAASMGCPPEFLQRTATIPNVTSVEAATVFLNSASQPPTVDRHREMNNNWESALPAKRMSMANMNTYTQGMNNSNQLNQFNNLPFTELLAIADTASGFPRASATLANAVPASSAAGNGKAVGGNIMPGRPYFPFSLYEDDNNQLQSIPANLLMMGQNYMINSNQSSSNNQQQMSQNGFPDPHRSTYGQSSTSRTMYDLNCFPSTMGDAVSDGNLSFQCIPATPDKGSRMQHNYPSDAAQNSNISFQFGSGGQDMENRTLQNHPSAAGPSKNVSFQFASALDNSNRAENSQLLGAVSNCSTSSQFAPVTPDKGIILQSNHISEMVNNLREELINQEMSKSKDVNPCVNNLQMHSSQESCLESVVNSSSGVLEKPLQVGSSSADLSAPIKENNQPEKAENGIDLNKTPQQKPRRKKHRPRVVREDKRKNTPKSTEKQSSTKGTPERKKRKYVRKNASSTSKTPSTDVRRENHNGSNETPSTDVIGEITDSNQHATRRSCKRSLNFDSEVQGGESHNKMQRPRDEEHQRNNNNTSSSYAFNTISESQLHVRTKYNDILGDKCLQLSDGFGLTVQQTLADVALDLNQNAAQMLGDYISLPEIAPQAARREFPSPECTPQTPSREILRPECTSQPPRREILRPETTPQPTRRELLRQNLNLLARTASSTQAADKGLSTVRNCQPDIRQQALINGILENHEHFVPTGLQRSIYEISKTQNNPDCSLNLPMAENRQETGSKRLHSQSIDERRIRSYNLIGPHINSLKTYYEMSEGSDELKKKAMLFPEIYKKRRTEKSQNTNTASKSHVATLGDYQKLTTEQITSQHYSVTPQLSTAQGNTDHHCNANGSESLRSGAWAPSHGYRSLSTPDGHSSHMQNIPAEPQRASDKQEPSELMLTIRQTGMKTGKRSKAHTRVRNLATLTSVTQCNNLQSPLRRNALTSHNRRVVETFQEIHDSMEPTHAFNNTNNQLRKYNRKGPHNVLSSSNGMRQQEHPPALLGYHHHSSMPRGSLEVTQQVDLPTAELVQSLVQRLNCLSISGERNIFSANEQNALVPFGGQNAAVQFGEQNALVPFEQHQVVTAGGTFALAVTVKRRPRPKVDLDEESNREWMRLMGKPSDGGEGMTPEKEKWWEEERRVLRSRADLFIARMHLIQGDRRFTKWNGSVLDSVIGVFLTQNVSDHLSSSAFMSLAARFPLKHNSDDKMCNEEGTTMYVEEPEMEALNSDYTKWHQKMPSEPVKSQDTQGSVTLHGADHVEIREIGNGSDSSESNTGCGCSSGISDREFGMCQAAPETKTGSITTRTGCASFVETEYGRIVEVESSGISPQISVGSSLFDMNVGSTIVNNGSPTILETSRGALEDAISSENAAFLFTNTKDEIIRPFPYFSSSEDDLATRSKPDGLNSSTSFMELLLTRELCNPGNEGFGNSLKRDLDLEATKTIDLNTESSYDQLDLNDSERWNLNLTNSQSNSFLVLPSTPNFQGLETRITPSRDCNFQVLQKTGVINVQYPQLIGAQSSSSLTSTAAIREQKDVTIMGGVEANVGATLGLTEQKISLGVGATTIGSPYSSTNKQSVHQGISLKQQVHSDKQPNSWEHIQLEVNRMCQLEGDQSPESVILDGPGLKMDNKIQQAGSNSPNFSGETLDVVESTLLSDKKDSTENTDAESMTKEQVCSSQLTHEISTNSPISNAKHQKDKKKEVDWDHLRKEVYQRCGRKERTPNTKDSLDWEAVRCADVNVIANAIKERGMNNMLAARIKAFLNRLVTEHEDIDLEWLRDVPGDKAKDYLLSVRGLGLKSVECVRLLTLHHLAFPVDTNVGRIAVRLGWVPLQPLPESLQLHLLELYPVLETIQKYLWPRLCKLDQPTLYELHYQLITFGKVFCTKSRPNCNACPMRTECKHFASAYTSSRLKLGYKDETGVVSSTLSTTANQNPTVGGGPYLVLPPEAIMEAKLRLSSSEPIIEVPASPEPGSDEIPESEIGDIEDFDNDDFGNDDFGNEDPTDTNGLPTIFLNDEVGTFESNIRNCLDEQHVQLRDEESKALVAVNPQTASIPTIPLKNKSRLRTEHQVYELPDSHPLLEGVEKRVPGDVGFYLLAIWTPGETAESTEPPERCCSSQSSGGLCNEMTCFSCNSIREAHSQTVRGTILIPCRTAMRGSFPLNGTYFQVNEVFADHDSSLQPINVPRAWLWHLPRRTVYFGTSVTAIFRGQTTEEIQRCFWKGYVCVRGFDRKTRGPRPLIARLHLSASRQNKQKQEKTKR